MENINAPSGNITKNLGNAGPALMTTIAGHEISCKLIDQRVKVRLENILIERAKEDLKKDKDTLDQEEYLQALSDLRDQKITGHFSFGSSLMSMWLRSVDGISQLLATCSNLGADKWSELLVSDSLEVNMLLQEILDNSFPDVSDAKKKIE
jgi:hypothetical protein